MSNKLIELCNERYKFYNTLCYELIPALVRDYVKDHNTNFDNDETIQSILKHIPPKLFAGWTLPQKLAEDDVRHYAKEHYEKPLLNIPDISIPKIHDFMSEQGLSSDYYSINKDSKYVEADPSCSPPDQYFYMVGIYVPLGDKEYFYIRIDLPYEWD